MPGTHDKDTGIKVRDVKESGILRGVFLCRPDCLRAARDLLHMA